MLRGVDLTWRGWTSLKTHAEWASQIATKDDVEGTSAPSLALAWLGSKQPVGLTSVTEALAGQAELLDFAPERGVVEAQTRFDSYRGGPRNHDLLLVGQAVGGKTVVSIESKVNEAFGDTVGGYAKAAQGKVDKEENTNAPARLDGLLAAFAGGASPQDKAVAGLRYQLFSGVAGAVAAAVDEHAVQTVFLVQEFLTSKTDDERRKNNKQDLQAFLSAVFDAKVPDADAWCLGPLAHRGSERLDVGIKLYIGKVVVDLR